MTLGGFWGEGEGVIAGFKCTILIKGWGQNRFRNSNINQHLPYHK